ncbi:tesmin isoform X2 [Lagopus leucura]|uniref:tesmin isoform X2 n=1 Tax=Lagopus leucura TaxID=30410 RepID=UPI001C6755BA|nr:tesmin isoform X2 [Lagopus leucura]
MENQILFDIRSATDDGFLTEILHQNVLDSSENFSLETTVINNPVEEGLPSSQGNQLYAINVEESLLDHFENPLSTENQNTIAVEIYPHGNNSCDNEDLEKYKALNLPEEADYTHSPYLPSDGDHFLSSVVTQHKNCSVPTSSVFSSEGAVNQNVGAVPAFRSLIPPAEDENNCIYYDQFKGIQNSPMQSKNLPDCFNECFSGVYGLPQTSASVYDEITEVRDAIRNATENHEDGAIFQSSNTDESNCELLALHGVTEESGYLHTNYSSPLMICQLEGGTQMLCIKDCGTQDLKTIHLIPQYEDQRHYLQSDVGSPVTAVLGQLLPVSGNLDSNKQEFEHEYLQSVASTSTFQPESNLQVEMTSAGQPFGSGITKSKKPCNCTKSQCLKLSALIETQKLFYQRLDRANWEILNLIITKDVTASVQDVSRIIVSALREPAVSVSLEDVKATCACLLVQAEEAEKGGYSVRVAERMIMKEFGRCLSEILHVQLKD